MIAFLVLFAAVPAMALLPAEIDAGAIHAGRGVGATVRRLVSTHLSPGVTTGPRPRSASSATSCGD
jgi:hypothetical protein